MRDSVHNKKIILASDLMSFIITHIHYNHADKIRFASIIFIPREYANVFLLKLLFLIKLDYQKRKISMLPV